jgi:hypothetical protein
MKSLGIIKVWEPPKENDEIGKPDLQGQTPNTTEAQNLKSPDFDQKPDRSLGPQKKKSFSFLKKFFDVKKIYGEDLQKYLSVDVVEPPQPSDIVWEHIGYKRPWWFSALIKLLVLVLFVVFFWIIYWIILTANESRENEEDHWDKEDHEENELEGNEHGDENHISFEMLLNIAVGAAVSATNSMLSAAFRKIGALEKAWTHTSYNYILATRISLGQWLNGTVAVIVAYVLLHSEDEEYKLHIFPKSGLVTQGVIILMANWFVHPFLIIFNPLTF